MDEQQRDAGYIESGVPAELEPDELEDVELAESGADDFEDAESDDASEVGGPGGEIEELVRYVASHLVQDPDELTVESEFRGGTVYVKLRVPESEMGRVIGREGRTAKAIRTLVSIAGSRHNVHARLDIDG